MIASHKYSCNRGLKVAGSVVEAELTFMQSYFTTKL